MKYGELIDRQDVSDTNVGDTISRQAAIRWVKTECNPYGNPTLDFESGKKVIAHLEQMPSAQPEIIRCKDCQHYVYGEDEEQYYCRQTGIGTEEDFYCAYGERRTDEQT